jgi:hypothetical protein
MVCATGLEEKPVRDLPSNGKVGPSFASLFWDGSFPRSYERRFYQRDSRTLRSVDALAFCLPYSAKVVSARFSSETDFCFLAILMASENAASIWTSSAPIVARKTPHSSFLATRWTVCSLDICRRSHRGNFAPKGLRTQPRVSNPGNRHPERCALKGRQIERTNNAAVRSYGSTSQLCALFGQR